MPYAAALQVSCEGDPFCYEDTSSGKDIVDVMELIWNAGFKCVSLQFLSPAANVKHRFTRLMAAYDIAASKRAKDEDFFVPVLSFNLYSPRCGTIAAQFKDPDTKAKFNVVCFDDNLEVHGLFQCTACFSREIDLPWYESHMHGNAESAPNPKLAQFFSETKETIVPLAARGLSINFELRGDKYSDVNPLIFNRATPEDYQL